MHSIRLLHIGDVHYPERNDELAIDVKDAGIGGGLVAGITPAPFKNVADRIRALFLKDPLLRGVLISGDLTSRGNMDGYIGCVNFLKQVLDIGRPESWNGKVVAIVPGNHDVPRGDVDPTGVDLYKKFERTIEVWEGVLPGVYSPRTVRNLDLSTNGVAKVCLLALNTCIGCGEKRYLPEQIRDELYTLMTSYAARTPDPACFDLLGEQLDTPAILEEHVMVVEERIQSEAEPGVAVILGHHPLLPQSRPRVDLYTELLNGGRFRSALATLGSTILYCHGHLHEDPVEVVVHPGRLGSRLIAISAPLFRDGFNLIELFFTEQGHAVGCAVHPYRTETFGSVRAREPIRIPLHTLGHSGSLCDERSMEILSALQTATLRFGQLKSKLSSMDADTLSNRLELLEWLGLVDIRNRPDPPTYWHVTRIGP